MENTKTPGRIWIIIELILITVLIFLGVQVATIIALVLFFMDVIRRRITWREVGFKKPDNLLLAVVISIVLAGAYQFISIKSLTPFISAMTGEQINLQEITALRGSILNLSLAILLSWTFAALGEEIIYRGYLYALFRKIVTHNILGIAIGIIFCSILFSIGHGYQGISGMIENAVFGILLSTVYILAKKNLWYPILIHGFVDTIGFCLILSGLYP